MPMIISGKKISAPEKLNCHYFKALLVMKMIAVFLFATCMQLHAAGYSQRVTLSSENVPLSGVLKEISKQTGYTFLYTKSLIEKANHVSVQLNNVPLEYALNNIFASTPLTYEIDNKTIIIIPRGNPTSAIEMLAPPVNPWLEIRGRVTDEQGNPLEGVSVVISDQPGKGVTTDRSGNFSIRAEGAKVRLVISFVGFQTQEVEAGSQSYLEITLKALDEQMNDIVVIGYGTARKKDLTGSVSTVSVGDMRKMPVARLDQALQGQVAGAQILQNNGAPGSPISFFIRGAGTIGNTDPLFVVDGIPTKINISTLNMADIESISVLKDASAAAMYGARAANGVVLINTKSGKKGKTNLDLDAYYGMQQAWKKLNRLNAEQWATVRNTALQNDGLPAVWDNISSLGKGTNWQDAVLRTAPIQSYNLSASGGNDKTTYFLSLGNFQQDGIIRYSDYERNSLRANIQSTPVKRLTLGNNFTFSLINSNVIPTEVAGVLKNALLAPPTIPVYRDGRFAGPTSAKEGSGGNPLAQAANANSSDMLRRLTNRVFAEYEIVKNLKIKSSLGIDFLEQEQKTFRPTFAYDNSINTVSQLSQYNSNYLDWLWENTASYTKTITNAHTITALVGTSAQKSKKNFTDITKTAFPGNDANLQYLDNGSIVQSSNVKGNTEEWSLVSYFGRADYNFKDKFLVSANLRMDGSSRFGAANRFGTFPSFAVGWNMSQEDFMQHVHFIDNLKLRASWGQLGNQDIGLYSFSSVLLPYYTTFGRTPTAAPGFAPINPPNPDVKWETTTQTDIGLELAVLQSKLTFEMDYYIKRTDDMLLQLPTPLSFGYATSSFTNAGSVKNTGFEFAATYRKTTGDFTYSVSGNFSTYRNEVISLGSINQPVINTLFFDFATSSNVGQPMYQFLGYEMDGIFQSQADIDKHATQTGAVPGDIRFRDIDNNGVINTSDRTFIGNPFPKITYGINANLAYKNFDCFIQLQGTQGNKIYNAARFWGLNTGETNNYSMEVLKSWTGEGTSDVVPRLSTRDPNSNKRASSRFVEDGSYMRIKNFQLGYTLPNNISERMRIRSLRIYLGANNLLTVTKYSGFDPEVGQAFTSTSNAAGTQPNLGASNFVRGSLGFDQISFPQARTITFGLQLGIL